jgi:hypothetical protein
MRRRPLLFMLVHTAMAIGILVGALTIFERFR